MRVDDRAHVGTNLVDLSVDIALSVDARAARIERLAVQNADLQNVVLRDERGRHGARDQEDVRVLVRSRRHMAEAVERAFVDKDLVGGDEVLTQVVVLVRTCGAAGHEGRDDRGREHRGRRQTEDASVHPIPPILLSGEF